MAWRAALSFVNSHFHDFVSSIETILTRTKATDADEITYETTGRHEPFKGTEVSRKSVAALVVECIRDSKNFSHKNLGVNKPNTDGDKPAFY